MVNDYNYSKDIRNWMKKHGNKKFSYTNREMLKLMPRSMRLKQ